MGIRKKLLMAAVVLLVLALAAFLLLHDWEPPDISEARGGPHILDENLRPQIKNLSGHMPEDTQETEGCDLEPF